jgi:hypothetical protein
MSETGRERLYWLVSVLALAVACAHLDRLADVVWPFDNHSSKLLILGVFLGALPVALVIHLLLECFGRALSGRWPLPRMFMRWPSGSFENEIPLPIQETVGATTARLTALGFLVPEPQLLDDGTIHLSARKPKTNPCHGFLDNAFGATVLLRAAPDGQRTTTTATVCEHDLVTVETGEREKLHRLAEYVSLAAESLDVRSVPLTAYTGLTLAWVAILALALMPGLTGTKATVVSLGLLGAVVYAAIAGTAIWRNRERSFGLRVVAAAVVLGALPFVFRAVHDARSPALARVTSMQWQVVILVVFVLGIMLAGETHIRRLAKEGRAGGIGRQAARRVVLYGGIFGLMLVGMGSMIWLDARRMTERQPVTALEIENGGARSHGRWVRVQGWMDISRSRWMGTRDGRRYFIPVISEPGHEPVAAVFWMKQDRFEKLKSDAGGDELIPGAFDGVVGGFGLNDEERAQFEDNDIPLTSDCVEVEYELTPGVLASRAWAPAGIGLGVLAAVGVVAGTLVSLPRKSQ